MTAKLNTLGQHVALFRDEERPTLGALLSLLEKHGAKPMHIHRLCRAWLGKGEWPLSDDQRFPKALLSILPDCGKCWGALLGFAAGTPERILKVSAFS